MHSPILSISQYILRCFDLILVVCCIIFCLKDYNPSYMRGLLVYSIVNAVTDTLNTFFHKFETKIVGIFTIYELLYFSYFLTSIIKSKIITVLVWFLDGLVIYFVFYHKLKRDNTPVAGVIVLFECWILIIPCLTYFKEMISESETIDVSRTPSFWMVTGILLYFFLLLPTLWISSYYEGVNMHMAAEGVYSINNYLQIICYLLFIKAMTCLRTNS